MEALEIRRGDIFYISKDVQPAVGSEQIAGRPGIIVSNDKANQSSSTVEVVFLTTKPKSSLPTHVTIRSAVRESIALCEQITTVSVERLGNKMCHISKTEMANVEIAMLVSLDLVLSDSPQKVVEVPVKVPVEVVKEVKSPVEHEVAEGLRDLVSIKTERDTYKAMYENLLDRIVRSGRNG